VKTTVTVSGWLSEPDVPTGDSDIDQMDSLDCAPVHTSFGRPLRNRVVAPSLVARMVRKSIGMTVAPPRSAESSIWTSRSVRLPPAVVLALSQASDD
jgi:hypothetical protein